MQVSKIVFVLFLASSLLFSFDIINLGKESVKKTITSNVKKLQNDSFSSLKDIQKISSVKDILDLGYEELINANLINIPGLIGIGIKCDLDKEVSVLDPCALMKEKSVQFKINLGVCAVDVGLSNKCIYDFYQKMCKQWKKKNIETPLKKARASAKNLKTKGDVILKKNAWKSTCDSFNSEKRENGIKNSNNVSLGSIEKKYYTPQIIYKYALYNTGAKTIFDSSLEEWKDCMFVEATGKINKDLKEKCKIISKKMPKTEYDVSKSITEGVLSVDDATIDSLDNDFKNIIILKAKYIQECSNSKNPIECENKLWENGFERDDGVRIMPKVTYNKQLEDIEKKNALLEEYIKYATLPDKQIVFMSEDFINTLTPKLRNKYRKAAKKRFYQIIVYKSFWRNITKAEKEALSIKFDAIKIQASEFYPQQAMQEINTLVSLFSLTNTSTNEKEKRKEEK